MESTMRICLDSNCLRSKDIVEKAVADATAGNGVVVLPDVLLAEMIKSGDWRSTMRSSLLHLRSNSDVVAAADGVGRAMQIERDSGTPRSDLVDTSLTEKLRRFLEQINVNEQAALASIEPAVDFTKPDIDSRLQNAITINAGTFKMVESWDESLPDDTKRRLRRGELDLITQILQNRVTNDLCQRVLESNGFDKTVARRLSESDSVCRRGILAYEASALRWFARGGLQSRKKGQTQNDYMDLDVLITGTYCDENRAQDRIIQELDPILRSVLLS